MKNAGKRERMQGYIRSSLRMGKSMKEIRQSLEYENHVAEISYICSQYETVSNFPDHFPKKRFYGPGKNVGFSGDDEWPEN